MKILGLIAAGLLGTLSVAPATASAAPSAATLAFAGVAGAGQTVVVRQRTVHREGNWHGNRGNRWNTRRVCTNRWSHGHRIRNCRTVRSHRW